MKKETEIQQKEVNTLIRLMKENPTLRVLPMVNTEVVGSDDYSWWTGVFGRVELDECWSDEERVYIRSSDEEELVEMALEGIESSEEFVNFSEEQREAMAEDEVNKLGWEKIIALSIKAY